jgi:FtsZ-binding cell division protein ZapB
MDSGKILEELEIKSKQAQETIRSLKEKIEKLKSVSSTAVSNNQNSVESLKNENRLLKEQVELLKNRLTQLDGNDAKPAPSQASVNKTQSKPETVTVKTEADESKKQKPKSN